jgi:hypothetical protein
LYLNFSGANFNISTLRQCKWVSDMNNFRFVIELEFQRRQSLTVTACINEVSLHFVTPSFLGEFSQFKIERDKWHHLTKFDEFSRNSLGSRDCATTGWINLHFSFQISQYVSNNDSSMDNEKEKRSTTHVSCNCVRNTTIYCV